ncbi:LacI family transcriptional regulator [Phytohabitans suffuscus]|uniref:LacI family transcriptional regulator n=1 Tax=Phytohabitans suffuscus TaxID=624315 RepID=A0A6F8Z0K2_9ACTN|nr:substrate-binding domain-containing protein [Phytohabitans suffuscus]BCB91960.1 LacI family transcriptional regulator [Phytohabitans suffuscus]
MLKPLDNTYFGAMEKGASEEAKKSGVELTTVAAASVTDDSGQANKLNSLVSSGYDCYIVNPTSGTNLLRPLVPVSKDGTPIVNIDLPISADAAKTNDVTVTTYIGTDNETAGAAAGEAMLSVAPSGKVAAIGGLAADPGSLARIKGFKDKVAGQLDVFQTVAADADRLKAKNAAAAIIRGNPDVKGFFTVSGDMSLGIQEAVTQAGKQGQIAVIGIDGTEDQLKDIQNGGMPAAVEQFPYLMGAQGVQACLAARDGKSVPAELPTPVLVVTKDNAAEALASFPAPPESFSYDNPLG